MKEIAKEQFDALKTTKIHEWFHDYGEDGIYEEWTKVMYNSIFSNIELLA